LPSPLSFRRSLLSSLCKGAVQRRIGILPTLPHTRGYRCLIRRSVLAITGCVRHRVTLPALVVADWEVTSKSRSFGSAEKRFAQDDRSVGWRKDRYKSRRRSLTAFRMAPFLGRGYVPDLALRSDRGLIGATLLPVRVSVTAGAEVYGQRFGRATMLRRELIHRLLHQLVRRVVH
jgi:hypothetical protein